MSNSISTNDHSKSYFTGYRREQLDDFLSSQSLDLTLLLALVSEIVGTMSESDEASETARATLEQAVLHFLRAARDRFSRLDAVAHTLHALHGAESVAAGSAQRVAPILLEVVNYLADSSHCTSDSSEIRPNLETALLALAAQAPQRMDSEAFQVLGHVASLSTERSHSLPRGTSSHRPNSCGRASAKRTLSLCAASALIAAGLSWAFWPQYPIEPLNSLAFVQRIAELPANQTQNLGNGPEEFMLRSRDKYSRDGVEKLLTAGGNGDCGLYRVTFAGVQHIASRQSGRLAFPNDVWTAANIFPASGRETFLLIRLRPEISLSTIRFGGRTDKLLEDLASTDQDAEVRRLLRQLFDATEWDGIRMINYVHLRHETDALIQEHNFRE
ncbi:hypothetical protein Pan44_10390 [Caulifigura coniformis]|uniref:Uncharacterized protein n=1 Tax=Caulifigura coniformis TaxID=2527983 RepID=A0A517SA75_9PLAN|nr:hypothetical protein [Caulifigura coniformis]QDT53024.1 hypothetical protein Pan44_10390 [Caulifigura coniformis]